MNNTIVDSPGGYKTNVATNVNHILTILSLIGAVYAFTSNDTYEIRVLPVIFAVSYIYVFHYCKTRHNPVTAIITSISWIRYSLLPILYSLTISNTYAEYLSYIFKNLSTVVIVMTTEMISIFVAIYLFTNKKQRVHTYYITKISENGLASVVVSSLWIIIVLIYPQIIRPIGSAILNRGSVPDSVEAVFQVSIIVSTIVVASVLRNLKLGSKINAVLTVAVFTLLIVLSSNTSMAVSRNSMMINTFILVILLGTFHERLLPKLVPVIVTCSFLYFCYITYSRFTGSYLNGNFVSSVFFTMSGYPVLNAYFAGPTNMDYGISMISGNHSTFGFVKFIGDLLSNVPFLNYLVPDENSIRYFNATMSNGLANDQIVPITIQSILYGGYLFTPLMVILATKYALRTYYIAMQHDNLLLMYCYLYICIVLSMASILCVNSITMLIVLRVLPVLAVGYLNGLFAAPMKWSKYS